MYESRDFCESIDCYAFAYPIRKEKQCSACEAYRLHQYLKDRDLILEEGSELAKQLSELDRYKRALKLACEEHMDTEDIDGFCPTALHPERVSDKCTNCTINMGDDYSFDSTAQCWQSWFLEQAKESEG